MTLEFSNKELDTFIELCYLGNWLANSTRFPDRVIKKYDSLLKKIIKKIGAETKQEIHYDELHDELEPVIKNYDNDVFFSELSKQYANYVYPLELSEFANDKDKACKQFVCNSVLERACEETLKANGLSVVSISLPDIQPRIEKELKKTLQILNRGN